VLGLNSVHGLSKLLCSVSFVILAEPSSLAGMQQTYSHSAVGLQEQFAAILNVARSHDETAFRAALDSLHIPNQDEWFAANFDSRLLPQLSREYEKALKRYQEHVSWVMLNFAKFDDFAVNTESLDAPKPLDVPAGEFVAPVTAVKVENFRLSSRSTNPQHGPPSWVSSFLYIDGKFRYVGGTYTFWDEGLDGVRGPSSLPVMVMHGRRVQGVIGSVDAIDNGPGVDGIVQFEIKMDGDGQIHATVQDGDDPFVKDADEYLEAQKYGIPPGANSPRTTRLARTWRAGDHGVTTIWSMEVVFWTSKQ
jgi:hypothetical protein